MTGSALRRVSLSDSLVWTCCPGGLLDLRNYYPLVYSQVMTEDLPPMSQLNNQMSGQTHG